MEIWCTKMKDMIKIPAIYKPEKEHITECIAYLRGYTEGWKEALKKVEKIIK